MQEHTASIALLTRSEVTRPYLAKLSIKPALEEPEDRQAIFAGSTAFTKVGERSKM